jgi:hypothetical protein
VRSHSKTATAGPTQRQVGRLGRSAARRLAIPLALLVALFSLVLGAPSALATAPAIPTTTVSAVTIKAAVLEADINPEGEATTYHFEYGLADCSSNPCTSVPVPDDNVGSDSSAVRVKKEIEGLAPETTYHFRVVATNGSGPTESPDRAFTTYPASTFDTSCANQAFRDGFAASLPDCRAYEMVSPLDKDGGDIATSGDDSDLRTAFNQASLSGDRITYSSYKSFGDEPSAGYSNQYLATRGIDGWTTHGINPPQGTTVFDPLFSPFQEFDSNFFAFSEDLSSSWLRSFNREALPGTSAVDGYANLYRRDNADGSFEALTVNAPFGPAEKSLGRGELAYLELEGASADGSHAVYSAYAALTPDAVPSNEKRQLYDFSDGEVHLVSVLPDGSAFTGYSTSGNLNHIADFRRFASRDNAISADGSRIFWTAGDIFGHGPIYVRIDGTTTVPVSAGVAQFLTAARDGSKVLFSEGDLPSGEGSLEEFDVDSETTTPLAGEVYGVLGAGDDLSYVYFVSKEVLDSGATAGEKNLYVRHGGATSFIGTLAASAADLSNAEASNTRVEAVKHSAKVTPDGRHLAFASIASLTGFDNTDALNGKADMEVYVFDADSDQLTCASCNPSGARPVGQALQEPFTSEGNPTETWAAAWLPTALYSAYAPRPLSDDGSRLFFNSFDALVPQDDNGAQDVYEWEAQGSGSCEKAGGCIGLISTGQNPKRSEFVDASADGRDVFFETSDGIDPRDPGLIDIYDARSGGGFPYVAPSTSCVGDACQNVPSAPNDPTPASANFRGAGNPMARKARHGCRARGKHLGKGSRQRKRKAARRCRRAKRRAVR